LLTFETAPFFCERTVYTLLKPLLHELEPRLQEGLSRLKGGGKVYETLRMKIKTTRHQNKVGIEFLIIPVAGISTIYRACLKNPDLRNIRLNHENKK
jgi:hypothetical protein